MGVIVRGTVAQGESFRGNCLGGKFRGAIVLRDFIGGNFLGGNYSGAIVWGGESPEGNCPGGNFMGGSCPGGIVIEPRKTFSKPQFSKFKKLVFRSVFGELQLPQISLNFKTSRYNLKIRCLGAKLCVVFLLF